ncbi:MAG: hypothetical protein M3342_01365 [Bacteroidota bacterium]|nr:hypothetical protein [Flavisolibacter sp.]MDQ3842653.1 hypothetical protein [Bacteroidota bacterium]
MSGQPPQCNSLLRNGYLRYMTQRYYFDTSVFCGVFDVEFAEDTLKLFVPAMSPARETAAIR